MSSKHYLSVITKENCEKAVENLKNSKDYLKASLELSGLESSQISTNLDLSRLVCAALSIKNTKKNIEKIYKVYIKTQVNRNFSLI